MTRVWNCLETQHDWRLVLVAALVCFLTSLAAVSLYRRARVGSDRVSLGWLLTAGAVTGGGIWSMHFIAVLAYQPGFDFDHSIKPMAASLLVATMTTTLGLAAAAYGSAQWSASVGGAIIGIGIACVHFMGMNSLSFAILWHWDLVVTSVALGIALSIAAVTLAHRGDTVTILTGTTALLTLATTVHHFVAMGAIDSIPSIIAIDEATRIAPVALGMAIAAVTVVVVIGCLVAAVDDRSPQQGNAEHNIELDAANLFDAYDLPPLPVWTIRHDIGRQRADRAKAIATANASGFNGKAAAWTKDPS
jgi:diguanylate cyclase